MRVYISGKITGDPTYKEKFEKAEKYIKSLGHIPINPAKLDEVMPKDAEYIEYMMMCRLLVELSDAVYVLNGYEESKGAAYELALAKHFDKKIVIEGEKLI